MSSVKYYFNQTIDILAIGIYIADILTDALTLNEYYQIGSYGYFTLLIIAICLPPLFSFINSIAYESYIEAILCLLCLYIPLGYITNIYNTYHQRKYDKPSESTNQLRKDLRMEYDMQIAKGFELLFESAISSYINIYNIYTTNNSNIIVIISFIISFISFCYGVVADIHMEEKEDIRIQIKNIGEAFIAFFYYFSVYGLNLVIFGFFGTITSPWGPLLLACMSFVVGIIIVWISFPLEKVTILGILGNLIFAVFHTVGASPVATYKDEKESKAGLWYYTIYRELWVVIIIVVTAIDGDLRNHWPPADFQSVFMFIILFSHAFGLLLWFFASCITSIQGHGVYYPTMKFHYISIPQAQETSMANVQQNP